MGPGSCGPSDGDPHCILIAVQLTSSSYLSWFEPVHQGSRSVSGSTSGRMQVFDDRDMFGQWFGGTGGQGAGGAAGSEDWLETEKRVVVIHRLHQILEPFMLRRQVEDVESKLPPKVAPLASWAPPIMALAPGLRAISSHPTAYMIQDPSQAAVSLAVDLCSCPSTPNWKLSRPQH